MLRDLKQARSCVGFLFGTLCGDDEPEPQGTCFFVSVEEKFLYLVTAKHVWQALVDGGEGFLRISKPGGGVSIIPLELSRDQWMFHEDESVDLAVQVWTRHRWQEQASDVTYWPLESIWLPATTSLLDEGEDAVFVGLMRDFPGAAKNLMMLRGGMVGLMPDEPIQGGYGPSDYFVLDAQSYKANSGAPVFLVVATGFHLIGVLTYAFYEEAERFKVRGIPRSYFNLGVSLVTPIGKLEEMLNTTKEKERRKSLQEGES